LKFRAEGLPRREFVRRCYRAGSAALLARRFQGIGTQSDAQTESPFDPKLLKLAPGSDEFVNERLHTQIAEILARWSADLLASPAKTAAIEQTLAPAFAASPLQPANSRTLRAGHGLEVHEIAFETHPSLNGSAFLAQLHREFSTFARMRTADFQVTRIQNRSGVVQTQLLYEFVGEGPGFYREQRTGFWELDWIVEGSGLRVQTWRADKEQRSRSSKPWYSDITKQTLGANSSYNQQLVHGVDYWRTVLDGACGIDIYGHNGVSVGDIDNDGFDDLYVCQPAGLPNRLYRNRGDGTFEDITESSGTGLLDNTACALLADFDNDGKQDLVVVRASGPILFVNEGNGRFRAQPDAFHFATPPQGTFTGAAAADYNRDGLLDVYFCVYVYYQGTDQYKYPAPYYAAENGPPNYLMRNNGDRTFRDVTSETGLDKNNTRYSFCCGWSDYNRDGWPDLYVVNDFGRKNLYRNNGDGTFTDVAEEAGVADVGAGMSVCWFDSDNDGAEDLYVGDMWTAAGERITTQDAFKTKSPEAVRALYRKHAMGNSLFQNNAGNRFGDITEQAHVRRGRWAWSSDAWDFDHDGFRDLYVANGMISGPLREDLNSFFWRQVVANSPDDARPSDAYEQGWSAINELIRSDHSWSGYERNVFFTNNRDGTFADVSGALGLDFTEDGRAFALADFDHDGRQELFLKNRNAPQLRVLKNVADELPLAIELTLRGTKSNRDAIGASVTIETETLRQTRMLQAGSGFLSQHSKELFFGLGQDRGPARATVRWPSGLVQRFTELPLNNRINIVEGNEKPESRPFRPRTHVQDTASIEQPEALPNRVDTWLLSPIAAPKSAVRSKPGLLTFDRAEDAGVYNVIYKYVFDRHGDLAGPTSFLINEQGDIVKIYQGHVDGNVIAHDLQHIPQTNADRLKQALPFAGVANTFEFARNHLSFGSVYYQHGYFDEAEASFLRVLRDDPSSAEASYGLGSIYLKREKLDRARDSFERAVRSKASYPDTLPKGWNNLGIIATRQGRTDEAIGYFQKALNLSAEYVVALENLGNAYRQIHEWKQAQQALERALILKPDRPELHYGLGMVFAQTNQPERANDELQTALKLRPDYPEALNNIGVLYVRTRRPEQAIAEFEECMRVAPSFDQAYLNLARLYALQADSQKARSVLLQLLGRQPNNVQAQKALDGLR